MCKLGCVPGLEEAYKGPCTTMSSIQTCVDLCGVFHNNDEGKVCGMNGRTYNSYCELTCWSLDEDHKGPCTTKNPETKCEEACVTFHNNRGGEVCGSDGKTYASSCHLDCHQDCEEDYKGPCTTVPGHVRPDNKRRPRRSR